jgi:hypothetical protein
MPALLDSSWRVETEDGVASSGDLEIPFGTVVG